MSLLERSLLGGELIILIIIWRTVTNYKISHNIFLGMWWVVFLRLLLPFHFPLNYTKYDFGYNNNVGRRADIASYPYEENLITEVANIAQNIKNNHVILIEKQIWLFGAIIVTTLFLILYIENYRRMRTKVIIQETWLNEWIRNNGMQNVNLYTSGLVDTPLTYGFFSPKIVLPQNIDLSNSKQLNYIMIHESIHIKRRDNLWKVVLLIAVVIHWFNPFVWIMYYLFNQDLEISCDQKVLNRIGKNKRKDYAMTLINMSEKEKGTMFLAFGNKSIKERILVIMKLKKIKMITVLALVMLSCLTIFAFTFGDCVNASNYEHQSVSNEEISLNIAYRISQSKEYDEYKELGISYDEEKNMFVYQGQTVGYFYDEFGKNQFNRFVNASGEIGIQIIRNSNYKICSIKEVDVDQYRNNDTFAVEQNFEAGEKSKTEEAFELNYLAEEFSLSDYNEFDFEYNESIGCWEYNGKKIKILYDQEKGVCLNQAINDAEAIYIVIERNSDKSSVKEVSYNEMLMLLNNTNFSFDGSGTCIEAN